jgi:hypothetical protein
MINAHSEIATFMQHFADDPHAIATHPLDSAFDAE